jgi:hypothetical protein
MAPPVTHGQLTLLSCIVVYHPDYMFIRPNWAIDDEQEPPRKGEICHALREAEVVAVASAF